ncbi:uncharacterized protein involved in exopolysaccharide biosynthesis [Sphingomonas sp. PvP055]|uniref:GumC family protein n=1 Tax=Sphingomonas sp. PvP055 TaxID=3156391 RepID=UPI003396E0A7
MDMKTEPSILVQGSRLDQSRHIGRKPVTLASLGGVLRRRWRIIGAMVLLTMLAAVSVAVLITPKYDAVARIRITPARQAPLDFETAKDPPLDQALVNTEIATIRSRDIARRVVTRFGLQGDPEFVGAGGGAHADTIATARAIETATSAVLQRLTVAQQERSYVLTIGVRSRDASKAARISNALALAYIDSTADVQASSATRQTATGQAALLRLSREAEAAAASVARYRADSGIVQGGGVGTINDQQVGPIAQQLASAKAEAAALRSNVAAAERQIATGGSDAVSAVLSAPVITDLRRQRTEAERQRAQLAARYGEKFPALIQSKQQIEALDQQIRLEQTRIIEGLRSEARSAAAKASDLAQQLAVLKQEIAVNGQAAVRAEGLQRKADAATTAYNRMAGTVQQAAQAQRSTEPQARILESAVVLARADLSQSSRDRGCRVAGRLRARDRRSGGGGGVANRDPELGRCGDDAGGDLRRRDPAIARAAVARFRRATVYPGRHAARSSDLRLFRSLPDDPRVHTARGREDHRDRIDAAVRRQDDLRAVAGARHGVVGGPCPADRLRRPSRRTG